MPRVTLTAEQRRAARIADGNEALRVGLAMSLAKTGTTQRHIADRLGVPEARISKVKRDPGSMSLDFFRDFVREADLGDAAIVAIVRGKKLT